MFFRKIEKHSIINYINKIKFMKVILSRKGFDSGYGGYPSPIFDNGRMVSLPIPEPTPDQNDKISYSDLVFQSNKDYYQLLQELGIEKIKIRGKTENLTNETKCHLDPDIYKSIKNRDKDWRPLFGQMKAAAGHLLKQNASVGDIFLFFGWFKECGQVNNKYKYKQNAKELNVIFGYLQIGQIINSSEHPEEIPEWATYHPHVNKNRIKNKTNIIFVSRENLDWNSNMPGSAAFNYDKSLVLTKENMPRTYWNLPQFFKNANISYHPKTSKKYGWKNNCFYSATRGQEFVISENKDVENWAKSLIDKNVII